MESATQKKQPEVKTDFISLAEGNLVTLAKSGEADSPRSFNMLAYTGAVVQRWYGALVIELSGIEFSQITPILKDHDTRQIVGQSRKVGLSSAGIEIEGFVLKSTEAAKEVARLSDENYQWQASAGLDVSKVERLHEGQTAEVNGKQIAGPVYIARKAKLREASFVPVGADGATSAEVLSFFEEEVRMSEHKKTDGTDAVALERKRCADLKAAFPKDLEFAMLAIEKGQSVQEAKAEYVDVLQKRNEGLSADLEKANKEKAELAAKNKGSGVEPLEHRGTGGGTGTSKGDFMEQAKLRASEKGISLGTAITQLANENPELHQQWVDKQEPRERKSK